MNRITIVSSCLALLIVLASNIRIAAGQCPYGNLREAYSSEPNDVDCPFANLKPYAAESASPYLLNPAVAPTTDYSLDSILNNVLRKYGINPSSAITHHHGHGHGLHVPAPAQPQSKAIKCSIPPADCLNDTANLYYRSVDGSCNNLQYPAFGISRSRYGRLLPPNYGNKIDSPSVASSGAPLPNARLLSLSMYGEESHGDDYRTIASMQWSQFVAHDLSMLSIQGRPMDCCSEPENEVCYNIQLSSDDPIAYNMGKSCLSFARSISDADAICPKSGLPFTEKISMATAYLDLGSLYGNTQKENNQVRLHRGGLMRTSVVDGRHFMPIASANDEDKCNGQNECYIVPDKRNRFHPTVIVLHTLWLRNHNRIANELAILNPHYDDERLYQEARKINIGLYQKITYYDWLPLILGHSYSYANGLIYYTSHQGEHINDYDENADPAPYVENAAAGFRYGHTQVPGWFSLVSPDRFSNRTMRLSNFFERSSNSKLLSDNDNFAALLRGMATQLQKRPDGNIDPELKHFMSRKENENYGTDLKSIDIHRSRDYGMPTYNDLRHFCGLPRAVDWSDFSNEISNEHIQKLQSIYATPDDVEVSVGGTLERHAPKALFGPTLRCVLARQLLKTRIGDRFFFENGNRREGFTREQLAEIRKISLATIFCNNAHYLHRIQPDVFVFPNTRNYLLNCEDLPQLDLSKWQDISGHVPY